MDFIDKKTLYEVAELFKNCAPVFIALGDEVRQTLILDLAEAGTAGINVNGLAAKSRLSRPAISHHLRILKDCGLIEPVKSGTQIFYRLTLEDNFKKVENLVNAIHGIFADMPKEATEK